MSRMGKQQNYYSDKNEKQSTNTYDSYKVLGVTSQTSLSEIKKGYRKLAKEYHPDLNHEEGSSEKFKRIQEAREIIMKK